MTSSSNLRLGSLWIHEQFETINHEFEALGRKYRVLPNFGICCRVLGRVEVTSFHAYVRSFYSVGLKWHKNMNDLQKTFKNKNYGHWWLRIIINFIVFNSASNDVYHLFRYILTIGHGRQNFLITAWRVTVNKQTMVLKFTKLIVQTIFIEYSWVSYIL